MHPASPSPAPPAPALHPRLPRGGHRLDPARTVIGLAVLAIGVLFVLDSVDVLDAGKAIDRFWPVAIVAWGLLELQTHGRRLLPLLLLAGGTLLLLVTLDAVEGSVWSYVWPLAVVAIGLSILTRRARVAAAPSAEPDDVVEATGVFGGPELRSTSQHFKRASLTAVFGGVQLDLRDALPDPAGATITATAVFGGIDVLVPRGWRIATRGLPVFGGIADKTDSPAPLPPDAPTLVVDGLALFGGVEIKHEKK